jgi:SAM-dependent methyltransferase
LPARS